MSGIRMESLVCFYILLNSVGSVKPTVQLAAPAA